MVAAQAQAAPVNAERSTLFAKIFLYQLAARRTNSDSPSLILKEKHVVSVGVGLGGGNDEREQTLNQLFD